ncbi:MAG: serine/threonine protein phosphatase [Gemmataceae bacterium]|nr:serine/threonine protein phosphatase [Gemmataceae bacterium]
MPIFTEITRPLLRFSIPSLGTNPIHTSGRGPATELMSPTYPVVTARDVMQPDPVTVDPGCPLDVVVGLMNLHRIGGVIVVRGDRSAAGIFTERDLLRRVGVAPPGWQSLPVSTWMTAAPHTIGPEADWFDAIAMMDRLKIRHLPVVEAGQVVGVISSRLLVTRRAEYLNRVVERRTRELQQSHDELLARDAELMHNLRAAGRLQTQLLLPRTPPESLDLRWGVHYAPLNHLGGDYYDIVQPGPDHLGILIADASGHSIAAGMVAIMSRIAFAEVAGRTVRPGEVLAEMNRRLQGLADERFVTAFYGVLDRRSRRLTYANAGHPYPLRYSPRTGTVQPLPAQGFLLGIMPGEVYREREVELEPGDRLCFYTDGLVEARNEIGEAFGTDRLCDCLSTHGREPAARLAEGVLACQRDFRGPHPPTDDVTLVVGELRAE